MSNEFKLVPVKPTDAMVRAGMGIGDDNCLYWKHPQQAYVDMLAVAPQSPALGGEPDMKSDDNAIHIFTKLMAHKMARSAENGRSGWQQCSQDSLSQMLREHVEKGDPVDVANFCMMLSANGFAISKAPIEFDVKPYGWVVGSQFYTSRSAAIEEAEKTPCIDVYTRAHLAPLQAELKRQDQELDDRAQWDTAQIKVIHGLNDDVAKLKARRDELEKDAALLDYLQDQLVDTIYLDDGRIIDIAGRVTVREGVHAHMSKPFGSEQV